MEIVQVIVLIQVAALVILLALLVAVLRCIHLIDKKIRQREAELFNPSKPLIGHAVSKTKVPYPIPVLKPRVSPRLKSDLNVSGYKTQAQADEEKRREDAPTIEDLLPTEDNV